MVRQSMGRAFFLAAVSLLALSACQQTMTTDSDVEEDETIVITGTKMEPPVAMEAAPAPMVVMQSRAVGAMTADMAMASPLPPPYMQPPPGFENRDQFEDVDLNPVKSVLEEPVSTFSIDVDTAAYAVARKFLNEGRLPPKDAVRPEELLNYFDYDYEPATGLQKPFSTNVFVTPTPWNDKTQLLHIGLKGYEIVPEQRPPLNLTLLIDVSGSMADEDKLPLAKKALGFLIDELGRDDRVSIAVYAGAAGQILEPTPGDQKRKILNALDQLSAGGSTAGGEGLRLAYALAEEGRESQRDKDGVHRVMLITDGDFNVGITNSEELQDFVERKRDAGIYLSVFGVGDGNYNDALMQKLAQNGNGTAGYIDTLNEGRRQLSEDFAANSFPIAKDVKIQVEFNPARISEYRLIGYETRALNREDFSNDQVDAGEIGSGHTVTAIYEITPKGSGAELLEPSRYGSAPAPAASANSDELAFLRLRYKPVSSGGQAADESVLIERAITDRDVTASLARAAQPARWGAAVAGYAQLLRGDPYLGGDYDFDDVIALAQNAKGRDEFGYRSEFIQLVRMAKSAAALPELEQPGAPAPY